MDSCRVIRKKTDLSSFSFAVFCLLIRLVNKAPLFSTSAMVKELHMKAVIRLSEGRMARTLENQDNVYNQACGVQP